MSIKATISETEEKILIHMEGGLTYECSRSLREKLSELAKNFTVGPIYLNLKDVDFVGSSGIGQFVESVKMMTQINPDVKIIESSPEFKKVFKLYGLSETVYEATQVPVETPNTPLSTDNVFIFKGES